MSSRSSESADKIELPLSEGQLHKLKSCGSCRSEHIDIGDSGLRDSGGEEEVFSSSFGFFYIMSIEK
jgi:hypothetical protein